MLDTGVSPAGSPLVESTSGIFPSPKPFGCSPIVGQGLTESAPPAFRDRAPAKQKSKGEFRELLCLGQRGKQEKGK
jgi:hypothetical protein